VCGGLHGRAVTDSKGRLFVPKGHCGFPWIATSEDGGDTWRTTQVSTTVSSSGVNVEAAVDDADNVYLVWWDEQFRLPWMSVSRDHARTWSHPVLIAPPGVEAVNFPSIAAGAPGRVIVTFPGTSQVQDTNFRPWNSYVLVSTDALDPQPIFQSATANPVSDPIHRGECEERCAGMLDFLDVLVAPNGAGWASAVDTCTGDANCVHNDGHDAEPGAPSQPVAVSMDGIAIREVCGPALRGGARDLGGRGCVTAGR